MDIILEDGKTFKNQSPITMCTGYRAKSLIMQKGDFEKLRQLSCTNPNQFDIVMAQLEGRFK